jgi:hypothetical protein
MPHSVAQLQAENVTFELEGIDRMYLNCYVPQLTSAGGVAACFRHHKGHKFASTKDAVKTSEAFRRKVFEFAEQHDNPVHRFAKGERKDDVMLGMLKDFRQPQGVVFIGVAQEKATVPRTVRKRFGDGKGTIPWIDYSTAMVNFYHFYCVDEDFGPFFLKFCSYFPYGGKLCINGHEYLKRQLAKRGVAFGALDNGLLDCAEPATAQALAGGFNEHKIERFFRKWLKLLPHPFPAADRKAGYRYQLSVLQAEFALTQVWERPVHGREFFEQVIRDNIDLGRPEKVQLIFARKMRKATATDGRCRTRVVTEGVIPSLHVYYKNTHLKQYHKTCAQGAALRTGTTINNSYDFGVGRLVRNLPRLREIGFAANRRVPEVETVSHDNRIGAQAFEDLQKPVTKDDGQRASALRFGDGRVHALLGVLLLLCLQFEGFRNRQLRPLLAQALGLQEHQITQGMLTHDLRRLCFHGLIKRIGKSHRYRLTRKGLGVALLYRSTYGRLLRPVLSVIEGGTASSGDSREAKLLAQAQAAIDRFLDVDAA